MRWRLSEHVEVEIVEPHAEGELALLVILVDGSMAVRHFLDPAAREAVEAAISARVGRIEEKTLVMNRLRNAHAVMAKHHANWLCSDLQRIEAEVQELYGLVSVETTDEEVIYTEPEMLEALREALLIHGFSVLYAQFVVDEKDNLSSFACKWRLKLTNLAYTWDMAVELPPDVGAFSSRAIELILSAAVAAVPQKTE